LKPDEWGENQQVGSCYGASNLYKFKHLWWKLSN
jgi:hypothetical protein